MYEGLTGPAERYRYLHPPPGLGSTPRPSSAHQSTPLSQGQSPAIGPATSEMPPQAQLLAARGAFTVPPDATAVVAGIVPVDPPPLAPSDGRLDGNVYRFAVTAAGMPLAVRPGRTVTVVLRGPAGFNNPAIERFAGGAWTRLHTDPLGTLSGDSYSANVPALGDLALVAPAGTAPGSGVDWFAILLAGAAVLLTAGTLTALRRNRRRPPPGRPVPPGRRRPPPPRRRR